MLYFYLACVALLFSGVIAQECSPVTAAWTQPRICNILYNTTTSAATNPALGDALSSFYSSLSPRPSESCAAAHAAYYCNKFYPECSADQTTALSTCLQACITLGEACSLDSDVAAFTGVTDYPIPASCTNPSPCSTPAPADLTSYYADCGEVELNTTLFGVQITNHIMCRPEYPVPESNITAANYAAATKVFNTFRQISSYLASLPEDVGMTDVIYPCVKYFSNFYCAKAFPSCGNNDALPIQPICASTCQLVVTNCSVWDELFDLSNTDLSIPTVDECNALPTTNCYSPMNNTYVGFFFGDHDPPVPVEPTTTPTTSTTRRGTSGPDHDTPTGGYAKGGGIGAGVLIGLLLIIGITMFIMKKQDSR